LSNIAASSADNAKNTKGKIKNAVSKTLNKDNLKLGAKIAGATVNAAARGFNKSVASVADNATATTKAAISLTDKELRNRNKSSVDSTQSRKKISAANQVLDKLRTDGDAEKASSPEPKKKLTSKEKEKKYDSYLKSGDIDKDIKSMKEDVEFQLDFIKYWLSENGIFETDEEIDEYILKEMTKDEYSFILSEENEDLIRKFVNNAKPRNVKGDSSKVKVSNKQTRTNMDNAYRKYKKTQDVIDGSDKAPSSEKVESKPLGKPIASPKDRNSLVATSKSYDKPSLGIRPTKAPEKVESKPLGKPIAPPKDRNSLVATSKSYDKPLAKATKASDSGESKPLGNVIDNPHNLAYKNALLSLHEPATKQKPYDRMGYSGIGRDNLTSVGRSGKTLTKVKSDDFVDKLKNTFSNKSVKPSSLVDTVSKSTKKLASSLVGNIKSKLYKEDLLDSDIKNWIREDEFSEVVEWLLENDIFEDDDELFEYLCEDLNWEDLDIINKEIEQKAIELIFEYLCDEETFDNTFTVLEMVLGEDFINLLEMMNSDSDFYEPIPIDKCGCGKPGCKTCNKNSWKKKVYDKMVGVK
jgi:hypothetical protein